jgi:hypothetical protein
LCDTGISFRGNCNFTTTLQKTPSKKGSPLEYHQYTDITIDKSAILISTSKSVNCYTSFYHVVPRSVFVLHHQMTSVGIFNLCSRKSFITIPAINIVVVVTHFPSLHLSTTVSCPGPTPSPPAPFANDPVRGPPLSASSEDVEALINDPKYLSTSLIDVLLQQGMPMAFQTIYSLGRPIPPVTST